MGALVGAARSAALAAETMAVLYSAAGIILCIVNPSPKSNLVVRRPAGTLVLLTPVAHPCGTAVTERVPGTGPSVLGCAARECLRALVLRFIGECGRRVTPGPAALSALRSRLYAVGVSAARRSLYIPVAIASEPRRSARRFRPIEQFRQMLHLDICNDPTSHPILGMPPCPFQRKRRR